VLVFVSENLADFKIKFKTEELKIFETEYWLWSLRPQQITLGAGILSLKRECHNLHELTQEEFSDLKNIIKVLEINIKQLFNYNVMNYLMLMMVDKHVHYHVIPRYEKEIKLFGDIWTDKSWPGVPNLTGEVLETDELMKISSFIKDNLNS